MNVGIGSEAAQFHFWEYTNRILQCTLALLSVRWRCSYFSLTFVHFRENRDASLHKRLKELPWLHAVHIVRQMVKSHIVLLALLYLGEMGGFIYLVSNKGSIPVTSSSINGEVSYCGPCTLEGTEVFIYTGRTKELPLTSCSARKWSPSLWALHFRGNWGVYISAKD